MGNHSEHLGLSYSVPELCEDPPLAIEFYEIQVILHKSPEHGEFYFHPSHILSHLIKVNNPVVALFAKLLWDWSMSTKKGSFIATSSLTTS